MDVMYINLTMYVVPITSFDISLSPKRPFLMRSALEVGSIRNPGTVPIKTYPGFNYQDYRSVPATR